MKCSECGRDFLPADEEEEICPECQLEAQGWDEEISERARRKNYDACDGTEGGG